MKRVLLILVTPALVLLSLWGALDFVVFPRLSVWIREKAQTLTQDGPAKITIEKVELRLLPPKAAALGIRVEPQGELARTLTPLSIPRVSLRFDLFEIILGRAEISAVIAEKVEGGMVLDPLLRSKAPPKRLPIDQIFEWTDRIPVRRIIVQNATWALRSDDLKLDSEIELKDILLLNRGQQIRLNASLPRLEAKWGGFPRTAASAFVSAVLTPQTLDLQEVRLEKNGLVLSGRGLIEDVANVSIRPRMKLGAKARLPLKDVLSELRAFVPSLQLPEAEGTLSADTEVLLTGTTQFKSSVRVRTEEVKVGHFDVGDANLEGSLTNEAIELNKVVIQHPAGAVQLGAARVEFRQPYAFRTVVSTESLDLQKLFQALNLHDVPVDLVLGGKLPCDGTASPFELRCQGRLVSDHLLVRSGREAKATTIVSLKDLEVNGETTVTLKDVSFRADLRIGQSRGQAEGAVDYNAGFKIDYKTPSISFEDVDNLANLRFAGSAAIDGHTRGNASAATFEMKLETRNFEFEDYKLGDVNGRLAYQAGHLLFSELELLKGKTNAKGEMDLDLGGHLISGAFDMPALDAVDVADIFSKIHQLPVELQGTGRGSMSFDGPLSLWKMNYLLKAQLKSPRVHGDSFDAFRLTARGRNGNLELEEADLLKGDSSVKARGGISHLQQLDISLEANGMRLEESEFVTRIRQNIAGQFNMTGTLTGPLPQPELRLRGSFSDLILEEQNVPSSFFNVMISKTQLSGETNLFGNKIQGEMQMPLGEGRGPLRIRLKTTDWAFTNLLGFIGAAALQNEYRSSLTADVDLFSESGRFDQASGSFNIRTLSLQRGEQALKNTSPIEVLIRNGRITLKNMVLESGGQAAIRVRGENFRLDELNLNIFANSDLRLLHLLAPFLEDIGGPFRVDATIGGSFLRPQIMGTANIRDGFVRLKGFPHSLEKLRSEIVFSQSRILFQDIRGQLADGNIRGSGSVVINGPRDIPVNIRIQGENLSMNVPDRVRTNGNANLVFSGHWFPFVLAGTYNVTGGVAEMEFLGVSGSSSVRVSPYLPKILRQAQFDPVLLDLQVNLDRGVAVRNSLMQGGVSGRLHVKGPPQGPGLLGKVTTTRGSRVVFRDREFDLLTGTVSFDDEEEINPGLYLSAQTRVNEYDINVLVQGRAKSPQLTMTSTPPLPDQEIISLLALGITSQGTAQTIPTSQSERQAQQQLGYEALGVGLSQTGLQKGLQSTTGLDVKITSSYDGIRNISVPKLSFTRTLTKRLDAVYLRPINSDSNAQEFRLQYQLNSNISAIGSYEQRDSQDGIVGRDTTQKRESIFGLDLEFKREFK